MLTYISIYFLLLNTVSCMVMYADKQKAKKKEFRIREATLWQLAFIGGALGALIGMKCFRHKTKHQSFKWGLPFLTVIQIGLLAFLLY